MEAEFRNHNHNKSKEETEGFSRTSFGSTTGKQILQKKDVCNEIIERLRESGHEAVDSPGFVAGLHAHFQHLPVRYRLLGFLGLRICTFQFIFVFLMLHEFSSFYMTKNDIRCLEFQTFCG